MPNTLAHIGIQAFISRRFSPQVDPAWIYIGCIIPDVPWILQRVSVALFSGADPLFVRSYAIAQASLIGCLPLVIAIAALSTAFRRVGAALALTCVIHLVLDALQTKWGNGVHLLAPFSWQTWNVGWFWPDNPVTYGLTALGLIEMAHWHHRFRSSRREIPVINPSRVRWFAAGLLVYAVLPFAFLGAIRQANAHNLATLESAMRAGRPFAFDRVAYKAKPTPGRFELYSGDRLVCTGRCPKVSGNVSARGVFVDQATVRVGALREHSGWPRDYASIFGLALVLVGWIRVFFARNASATI